MKTTQKIIAIVCVLIVIVQVGAAILVSREYLIIAFVAALTAMVSWPGREREHRNKAPYTGDRIFDRTRKTHVIKQKQN